MYVKINPPKALNKCTCAKLVDYLEKENEKLDINERQLFFSQNREDVPNQEVILNIDKNKAAIARKEDKYYMISINPSQKELKHICKGITGRDIKDISQLTKQETKEFELKLKEYTRNVMDEYAKNFNKGLSGKDILYYGKVEHIRTYKRNSKELLEARLNQAGLGKKDFELPKIGDKKAGLQSHIHVIVSRKDMSNTVRLSPFVNARNAMNKLPNGDETPVGFDRKEFTQNSEKAFDAQFGYKRDMNQSFRYFDMMKNQAGKITKSISYNALPEEMRTIGRSTEEAIRIISMLNRPSDNLKIANSINNKISTLNYLKSSSDMLKAQSSILNLNAPQLGAVGSQLPNSFFDRNPELNAIASERKALVSQLNKDISAEYKLLFALQKELDQKESKAINPHVIKVKELREEKLALVAPFDEKIKAIMVEKASMMNDCLKPDYPLIAKSINDSSETLSQLKTTNSALQAQSDALSNGFKILDNTGNPLPTAYFDRNAELNTIVSERKLLVSQLNKDISAEYKLLFALQKELDLKESKEVNPYALKVKELREQKLALIAPFDDKIRAIMDEKLFTTLTAEPNNITHINRETLDRTLGVASDMEKISAKLTEIHSATNFLSNTSNLSPSKLAESIENLQTFKPEISDMSRSIDNQLNELHTAKKEIWGSIKGHRLFIEAQYDHITPKFEGKFLTKEMRVFNEEDKALKVESLKASHEVVKNSLTSKVELIDGAITNLKSLKDNVLETSRVLSKISFDPNTVIHISRETIDRIMVIPSNLEKISAKLTEIHSATDFLKNPSKLSSAELSKSINYLKSKQLDIFGTVRSIDNQLKELYAAKNEIWGSIKGHRLFIEAQYDYITPKYEGTYLTKEERKLNSEDKALKVSELKESHEEVKKLLQPKIELINNAITDLKASKEDILETSKVLSNTQRAKDPLDLIRATFQHVPVAREVLQVASYAYNPSKIVLDIGKKILSVGLNSGL